MVFLDYIMCYPEKITGLYPNMLYLFKLSKFKIFAFSPARRLSLSSASQRPEYCYFLE